MANDPVTLGEESTFILLRARIPGAPLEFHLTQPHSLRALLRTCQDGGVQECSRHTMGDSWEPRASTHCQVPNGAT
jgi:hypothetical protein